MVEQNDPTGELVWSFRFDRLAKGCQGLRVTLGIHCCPELQKVYQKEPVLVKQERQHNLSCTCVGGLGFFCGGYPGCSTGDFVVSIMIPSDDIKTYLVPGTHSLPWHSAADQ